ncbi:Bug family tripartite tricarboxylate transporter substrate binding protein [Aliihoeflea sp. PC F10.4]
MTIRAAAALTACLVALSASLAHAQGTYPERPVTLVVPFPPGGTLDVAARLLAAGMEPSFGQRVIVENRPGAGGNIGADHVAKSEADGYTLVLGALSTHGVNVSLYRDMPFDPVADFEPVSLVARTPNVLVVNADMDAETVADFIESAKADEDGFMFSSGSIGSAGHLAGELLNVAAGIDATHIPYQGSAAAMQAVLAGEVDFIFDNLASASSHIDAGSVRPLAVTTAERTPFAPDLPTMVESGFADFDITTWFGVLAPAGTPQPAIERLNAEIRTVLESDRFREALAAQGAEASPSSPAEFADFIDAEIAKYAAIIDEAGIEMQ